MGARTMFLSLLTLIAGLAIGAPSAHADQSCVAPLQARAAQTPYGYGWDFEMSIHREDTMSVSYARRDAPQQRRRLPLRLGDPAVLGAALDHEPPISHLSSASSTRFMSISIRRHRAYS